MDITHVEATAHLSWLPRDTPESFEEAFRQAHLEVLGFEERFADLDDLKGTNNSSEVMVVFRWCPKDRVEWTIRVKPNSDFGTVKGVIDRNAGRQGLYGPGELIT